MTKIAATFVALATLIACAGSSFASVPAHLEPALDPSLLIRRVIEQQLAAFNRSDKLLAFELSAPSIQRSFGTADAFTKMVKTNFAQLHHSSAAVFLDLRKLDDRFVQRVQITGFDGKVVLANYVMVRVNDGSWRVGGVLFDKAEEANAGETPVSADRPVN